MADAAFKCLAVSAFAMAFNLPIGRGLLVISIVLYGIECWKSRRMPEVSGLFWLAALFLLMALISTLHGVDPAGTFKNLRKLPWYLAGIFAYASMVRSPWRLSVIMHAFAAGAGVLAIWVMITGAAAGFHASGDGGPIISAVKGAGSMTDAQILMAGMLITLAVIIVSRKQGRRCLGWVLLILIQGLALLITFKRGSWMCFVAVLGMVLGIKANWRYVAGLFAAVVLIALLPPVRARLADLGGEFDVAKGGRMTMWFKIAPAIHQQYPWLGIGWRAMTNERMVEIAENVERNRNHLHSNIAEVLVETGWIGFGFYVLWMGYAFWQCLRFHIGAGSESMEDSFYSLALLSVFCALLCNGLVEFNFADGEIVIVYAMVMGCAVAGVDRLDFRPPVIRLPDLG
jgi:O-antigen ligase